MPGLISLTHTESEQEVSLFSKVKPTLKYWMETEIHVYGFSIAANALLAFFPFLIVMVSLFRHVLHWPAAEQAVYLALQDYFPYSDNLGNFVARNLRAAADTRGSVQLVSLLLLLFTANGIFEPLEVALNKAWGVKVNRSYLKNQLVSLGLVFLCGGLAVFSTMLTAFGSQFAAAIFGAGSRGIIELTSIYAFRTAAVPVTVLLLFFIYWLLPNQKISPLKILPVAVLVALALEAMKYANMLLWPLFRHKFQREFGPFLNSAFIIFYAFFSSMVVLAGAEWAGRHAGSPVDPGSAGETSPVPDSESARP